MTPLALDAALLACVAAGVVDLTILNLAVVPALTNPTQPVVASAGSVFRSRADPRASTRSSLPLPPLAESAAAVQPEQQPTLVAILEFEIESRRLGPRERYALKQSLPALRSAAKIMLVGHADATGTPEYNDRLSQERADAAARFLLAHGIPAEHVALRARGFREPPLRGNGRRVEIFVGGTP